MSRSIRNSAFCPSSRRLFSWIVTLGKTRSVLIEHALIARSSTVFLISIIAALFACTKNVKTPERPALPRQRGSAEKSAESTKTKAKPQSHARPQDVARESKEAKKPLRTTSQRANGSNDIASATREPSTKKGTLESKQVTTRYPIAETILSVDFGPEPDQFGYEDSEPGTLMGPCGFAVDQDERIYIADPLKERIVVFHKGVRERDIKLEYAENIDLRILPNGELAVTTSPGQSLSIYNRYGQRRFGVGCGDFGGLIRIFLQPDGIWVYGFRKIIKALDRRGKRPADRPPVLPMGHLSRDGKWLIAIHDKPGTRFAYDLVLCERDRMLGDSSGKIPICDRDSDPKNRVIELEYEKEMWGVDFGTDDQGRIHMASLHQWIDQELKKKGYLTTFSPDLRVLRKLEIPASNLQALRNIERSVDFTANGDVYYLSVSAREHRAFVIRYRWRDN